MKCGILLRKWTKDGTIAKIFESFSPNILKTIQIQIDSTYVKAQQHSSGSKKINQAIGKSRAGMTIKIHDITDSKGHAINFAITEGNTHDVTQTKGLMSSAIHKGVSILADRAYDSNRIVEYIESESAKVVIPSRKNRKTERDYDEEVYKNRNQIERFFNRIKQCRRIATRYDKLVSSFLSFIQLATTLIVLPKFPSNI